MEVNNNDDCSCLSKDYIVVVENPVKIIDVKDLNLLKCNAKIFLRNIYNSVFD